MRRLVMLGSRLGLVDRLITAAQQEPTLQRALFDAVSAHRPYRTVAAEVFYPPALVRLTYAFVQPRFHHDQALPVLKTE